MRWFEPVRHETSSLRYVNEAHFAWEQAIAQGESKDAIARKKLALDVAKQEYIRKR